MGFLLSVVICFIISSCTLAPTKKEASPDILISEFSEQKISEAKNLIQQDKLKDALIKLTELIDENITPVEKALKYNLKGFILFNMEETEKSLRNFEVADKYTPVDTQLFSQVQLNMASVHFRLKQFSEMKLRLDKINAANLSLAEQKKFHQLGFAHAKELDNKELIVYHSLHILRDLENFNALSGAANFETMMDAFKKLDSNQRFDLLVKSKPAGGVALAFLIKTEIEERQASKAKDDIGELKGLLKDGYQNNQEVGAFLQSLEVDHSQFQAISFKGVGLILPLSGEKQSFGHKALSGVELGLKVLGQGDNIKIHSKDSFSDPTRAAQAVVQLVQENKVAFIIGGLFPETATAEYLEAKKHGVLYISLSQINLSKEEKNHHLIEIQGSIESQVETLLSDNMIQKFGNKLAVIYPDSDAGKAYMDEIWRKSVEKNVQITSVAAFPKNTHDYRNTAQEFLGLQNLRERSEELKILTDVYSLEKSSIRRVQTLPPVLDFDWIFLATYPHEAIGLIPTLGYYDANRLKVVGGPSWVSKSLVKEQKNLGTLYFIGDDPKDLNTDILKQFEGLYTRGAGLIEILALDSIKIGVDALDANDEITARAEFDNSLKQKSLKGLSTSWVFKEGSWIKEMRPMTITRGEIVKTFEQNL
jgi:outer membrane PBP1 activator LpoA protein